MLRLGTPRKLFHDIGLALDCRAVHREAEGSDAFRWPAPPGPLPLGPTLAFAIIVDFVLVQIGKTRTVDKKRGLDFEHGTQ